MVLELLGGCCSQDNDAPSGTRGFRSSSLFFFHLLLTRCFFRRRFIWGKCECVEVYPHLDSASPYNTNSLCFKEHPLKERFREAAALLT